jgi:glycine oxidase
MSRHPDVVVVGGGVIGCAVAWFLAREGVSVTLLEREDVACQASGAAAGMLLPYGESDTPGTFLAWGQRGLAAFPALCDELREAGGIDPEFEASGALHVATHAQAESRLRSRLGAVSDAGLEWLDPRAARDAESSLRDDVRGALWSPREAHVRSPLLTRAYAAAAEALGARIERGVVVSALLCEGARSVGVDTSRGAFPAGAVVLCGGAWTPQLAPFELPIEPIRGQIASLDNPSPPLRHIVLEDEVYLVPKRDGSLVVGATEERRGFDCRVTAVGVAGLLASACALAPRLGDTGFRGAWAGLRPATPDRLPFIGAAPHREGLFVAAGHFRNGVLLSSVTGQLIAAELLGKPVPGGAEAFQPGRFAGP